MNNSPSSNHGSQRDFDEALVSPALDPLDGHVADFDWAGLYERLGEAEHDLSDRDYAGLTTTLIQMLDWIIRADLKGKHSLEIMGRRALTLAWTISPAYIDGSPSLTHVANELGLHKASLSCHAAEAHRRFGIGNRAQVGHAWNFKPQKGEQR